MEYRYGMKARGFGPGCQPKEGLQGRDESYNGSRFKGDLYNDILIYNRPLTESECKEYDLVSIQ